MKKTLFIVLTLGISLGLYAGREASDTSPLIFKHYILAQEALAADNFEKAKGAIEDLVNVSERELNKLSVAASGAKNLKSIREAFKPLSDFIIEQELPDGLVKAYCPMVKSYWLQKKGDVANPYFGKSMLKCGVIKSIE